MSSLAISHIADPELYSAAIFKIVFCDHLWRWSCNHLISKFFENATAMFSGQLHETEVAEAQAGV